jgi:hypothetical protein
VAEVLVRRRVGHPRRRFPDRSIRGADRIPSDRTAIDPGSDRTDGVGPTADCIRRPAGMLRRAWRRLSLVPWTSLAQSIRLPPTASGVRSRARVGVMKTMISSGTLRDAEDAGLVWNFSRGKPCPRVCEDDAGGP